MALPKFIIEVRVNEGMERSRNPHVPYGPEEIAADAAECVRQGASIIHYHAREPDTGAFSSDPAMYVEIEHAIRKQCDIITMPTLGAHVAAPPNRISHVLEMAKDPVTKPDCVPIDVITTNMALYDDSTGKFGHEESVYENTVATLKSLCESVRAVGVKPVAMLWNVASIRVTEKLVEMGIFTEPLYSEVVLFDGMTLGFGHPGTIKGLHSMLEFLPRDANWHWLAHCHGNTIGIAAGAIECGGHATIGLGDYAYPELGLPTNAELVAYVAGMARAMGREVATVEEARDMLGMPR